MHDPSNQSSTDNNLARILGEAWDQFHPVILWWADRSVATRPENAEMVYRELALGPREALPMAGRLRAEMQRTAKCR